MIENQENELLNGSANGPEGAETTPPEVNTPAFEIPQEYINNQDISSAKSISDLCKTIVNQQKLIGQKYVGIPNENSSSEEIAKYREAIGVPINFEDYDLGTPAPEVKEVIGEDDPVINKAFKQLFFDAGISQKQAKMLRNGYDQVVMKAVIEQKNKVKQMDDAFEKLISDKFGAEKDEKLRIAKEFMKNNISENVKELLPHVLNDNKALMVVADMANNLYPHTKPDNIRGMSQGGVGFGNEASIKAEMQKVIASSAYQNSRDLGHDEAVRKLDDLAKALVNLRSKK